MIFKVILPFVIALFSIPAFSLVKWDNPPIHLPKNVAEWLWLEVNANPAEQIRRTSDPLHLEHIDIPQRILKSEIGIGLRPEIYDSLVFESHGEKYIRWIFNPEDNFYRDQVIEFVTKATGTTPEIKRKFVGYLTASRSTVVQNPDNGALFSLKASTAVTGGWWQFKKMTAIAAQISRAYSDYIAKNAPKDHLKSFVALPEPFAVIAEDIDVSFTIRDYPAFTNENIRMIPFFTALHTKYGAELAHELGSEDPESFWNEHAAEPWGLAMAEALAYYGFYPNSAHSQDFLVECDEHRKPTGRIYARDIMDSDGDEMILKARGAWEVLDIYKHTQKIRSWPGKVLMWAMPFNGQHAPEWMKKYQFNLKFYEKFIARYSELTGVKGLTVPDNFKDKPLEKEVKEDPNFLGWIEKIHINNYRCQDFFH